MKFVTYQANQKERIMWRPRSHCTHIKGKPANVHNPELSCIE